MANDVASIKRELAKLQKRPLSIIRLSDPIHNPSSSTTRPSTNPEARESSDGPGNPSSSAEPAPSPASLVSDLAHYRELFKKLHFSYLEQVSKEKFLRAIVGDPPQVVEPADNAALEQDLALVKAELKAQKDDVAGLVADLEAQGMELAKRYDGVRMQSAQLGELPAEIEGLESRIAELEQAARERESADGDGEAGANGDGNSSANPRLRAPLPQTLDMLDARKEEIERLDKEIHALKQGAASKTRQIERLEAELRPLENQRNGAAGAAEEARRRKEMREGGLSDEVELKGRWYTGVNEVLGDMVGVEGKD